MRILLSLALILSALAIVACESAPATTSTKQTGTTLGDSGISVHGSMQTGGTTTVR